MAIEFDQSRGVLPGTEVNGNGAHSPNGKPENLSAHAWDIAKGAVYERDKPLPVIKQDLIDRGLNGTMQLRIVREIDKARVEIAEAQRTLASRPKAE